jgi:hypothetical protein
VRRAPALVAVALLALLAGCAGDDGDGQYSRSDSEACLERLNTGNASASDASVPGGIVVVILENGIAAQVSFHESEQAAKDYVARGLPGETRTKRNVVIDVIRTPTGGTAPVDDALASLERCLA